MAEEQGGLARLDVGEDRPLPTIQAVPAWLQLGVIVSDGSLSMTEELPQADESLGVRSQTKAEATDAATSHFLDRMQASDNKRQFSLAWISFNSVVTDTEGPTEVDTLSKRTSFDPTANGTGGTSIGSALEAAAGLVEAWRAKPRYEGVPMSAVVVLMTDGEDGDVQRTIKAAQRVIQLPNTRLAACFFATKGRPSPGADFLRQIVSPPVGQNFKQVYDGEALRDFFHASVSAVG